MLGNVMRVVRIVDVKFRAAVKRVLLSCGITLGALSATLAGAATLPEGFTETQIASGLATPTAMAVAPDGRLFVAQQGGQLRVIKNGALLATPFVSLTVNSSGERGLLGVAFDPDFSSNQFVYVYYTSTTPAVHNRVSRFTANGDVAVSGSETVRRLIPCGLADFLGGERRGSGRKAHYAHLARALALAPGARVRRGGIAGGLIFLSLTTKDTKDTKEIQEQ